MSHQLFGDLFRKRRGDTAPHVNRGQFALLAVIICCQFRAFQAERRLLGICLGADGNVLASGHRHGARDQAGDSRDHHVAMRCTRCRDPEHEARGRNDAVVGAQDRSP